VVDAEGDEAVSRRKEFNDVDQVNDLVGIGRELIMLLKCILVFLVLVAIVFVVAKLA